MGSLESSTPPPKRAPLFGRSANGGRFLNRPRSRIARFLLFEKVDYIQWVFVVAAFFFVIALFQWFLPGSVVEKSEYRVGGSFRGFEGLGGLDFGEGIRFEPRQLAKRWEREQNLSTKMSVRRFSVRKPLLAVVVPDFLVDGLQLKVVSVAVVLKEIGYDLHVFSFNDGPVHSVWKSLGVPVTILPDKKSEITVDWLDYNAILVNFLEARPLLSCLLQEPFRAIPVIWTIHERSLAIRSNNYVVNGQLQLLNEWKEVFNRASVIVFPTHVMPMMYSPLDTGNYFVVPGSPEEAWDADTFLANMDNGIKVNMGYQPEDFLIAIVSSQFSYSGKLLEHALVLEALAPMLQQFMAANSNYSLLKVCILIENSTDTFKTTLGAIAQKLGYPSESLDYIIVDEGIYNFLGIANLVIYGSFLEEQSFPVVLMQAMSMGKLVVAPDLEIIKKYVDDRGNAYLFPRDNIGTLRQIILDAVSNGKLSLFAQRIASVAKGQARNLMASEAIKGYISLLENAIKFPSEFTPPSSIEGIHSKLKDEWQWHLFVSITDENNKNRTFSSFEMLDKLEKQWNHSQMDSSANTVSKLDEAFSPIAWEEEKRIEILNARKRIEDEELRDRSDQQHSTWEEVYRNAKHADRARNELHERDDRELERTGQPLCIYEPYFGEGTWPFLHQKSLYRGIGMSAKGRRPGADDIDASSRLPVISNAYYRDLLGEFGAFFALANRIDRVHKNAWIGFQSWRTSARKVNLSEHAEAAVLEAIQKRRHGDTLYFWVRMDKDQRNRLQMDFWDFCDSINAGNCRSAVSEALQRMYGLEHDWNSLPQMPNDGDSWSVTNSWILPTRSFLEFVMFSRMFLDAMDSSMYGEHHQNGLCYLSTLKDRKCYSRVLELLVNVWAYHSARKMVYINPETGEMREQHRLHERRGRMWIKWFSFATLKSMDEDLAEEADSDKIRDHWLWPKTGEVVWQGVYDRERNMRQQQKERRKKQSKDKIQRIKQRTKQKALGKYIKPPPDGISEQNTTTN